MRLPIFRSGILFRMWSEFVVDKVVNGILKEFSSEFLFLLEQTVNINTKVCQVVAKRLQPKFTVSVNIRFTDFHKASVSGKASHTFKDRFPRKGVQHYINTFATGFFHHLIRK